MQVILGALAHALQPVFLRDSCMHAIQVQRRRIECTERTAKIAADSAARAVVARLQFK